MEREQVSLNSVPEPLPEDEYVRVRTPHGNGVFSVKRRELGDWGLTEADVLEPKEDDAGQS
jgi:hypothetical protein